MSDSSDSEVSVEIPYSKRPEWSDVKLIVQDQDTNDVVRIAYTETFREVYDYYRAVLKSNEKSQRVFELNKDAALLNPANYTVWYHRRILIKELASSIDLHEELDFITDVIRSNPKNYQVWQHRRNIIEYLNDPSNELTFTQEILRRDSKNYHAWQYRQWVIKKYDLWQNELDYINNLLDNDIRNNSAWNQRYFYISQTTTTTKQVIDKEIEFTLNKINICVDNESSWNYLRGLLSLKNNNDTCSSVEDSYPLNVIEMCQLKLNSSKNEDKSPFLISFYVDYNLSLARDIVSKGNIDLEKLKLLINSSIQYLESLANKYDVIRVNYWQYLIKKYKIEFNQYIQ